MPRVNWSHIGHWAAEDIKQFQDAYEEAYKEVFFAHIGRRNRLGWPDETARNMALVRSIARRKLCQE